MKRLFATAIAGMMLTLLAPSTRADVYGNFSVTIGPHGYGHRPPPRYYYPPGVYVPPVYGYPAPYAVAPPHTVVCWSPGWWQDSYGQWHWRDHQECF
jgi:hypothetical protein